MIGRLSNIHKHLLFLAIAFSSPATQVAIGQEISFADAKDALGLSPFDLPQADPRAEYLLKVIEYGTQHQKIDLVRAIEEQNGSIDWLHLIMYDSTAARYAALGVVTKRNAIESAPHLLNFIERTYEEAKYTEGGSSHIDLRPFKYQKLAMETVETIIGEPIIDTDSIASGSARHIGAFVVSHGYRDEMKETVLNAERLLERAQAQSKIADPEHQGQKALEADHQASAPQPDSQPAPSKHGKRYKIHPLDA
ncbi:hypothetical protein [Pelagicoccus sp. SDUM812005]|uniref:hypothetical protein n=1 Tax=Pelagicoccus sp. SDUM812005 TaxID=3041257 RepID=UPI002811B048|nr:hypothetical protein [Pelagicoccus sp. SDUM812005]